MYNFYPKKLVQPPGRTPNILLVMKLTTLFIITFMLQVSAKTFAQKVTLSEKNATLTTIFEKISKQTGYDFLVSTENLKMSNTVTINVADEELKPTLDKIFAGQPLTFVIQDKIVVVSAKDKTPTDKTEKSTGTKTTGKVVDEEGQPVSGATVRLLNTAVVVSTNKDGDFTLPDAPISGTLTVTFIGYGAVAINFNAGHPIPAIIKITALSGKLDAVQIIGYGQTTKRFNTGSVSTLTSADIEKQPVTNVLSAISGRLPGVFVQTANGLPGGNVNIQIRGKGSVTAGTNPLYIIDGVPFNTTVGLLATGSTLVSTNAAGVISPFNILNPDDIESISVLKDADATAIYGSRGSNGVVLITTKKGKADKTQVNISLTEGVTQVANKPKLLNPDQYQEIISESFVNDGKTPSNDPNSANYAPSLTVWKNNLNTDWVNYFLGGTGHLTTIQGSVTGGSNNTRFTVGGNYHSETTYLPGDNLYQRGGIHADIQHTSENKKFFLQLSSSLVLDNNKMVNPSNNLAFEMLLSPNYPIYDGTGAYNWYEGANPVAEINAIAITKTYNAITNLSLKYALANDLSLKVNMGYNRITINQTFIYPDVSLYPGTTNYTNFGANSNQSFIVEPQADYTHHFGASTLNLLAGATYQNSQAEGSLITATGFSSTSLMSNIGSASTYALTNLLSEYKYASVFGRATYNLNNKYILNLSVRQDASSKFGPEHRSGTFGAIAGAWIWGDEASVKNLLPFLSYGKLRAGYGITGNDQITDYQYLPTYKSSALTYQGISGLTPSRIANDNFHWETTKKLEVALELGFFKNRLFVNTNWYRNLSEDQLVAYTIPYATGFTSYQANLPAVVKNTGWEFELNSKNIAGKNFQWLTTFNLTIPRNVLLSFKDLATSSYANTLVIGEDITRIYGYQFAGLNASGTAQYLTKTGTITTSPSSVTDLYFSLGKQTPDLYGGIGNTFSYKNWSLDIFGQFTKQVAFGSLSYTPGALGYNNYALVYDRWTSPASQTNIPKSSALTNSPYKLSSANLFDASYFRLKNIALSYGLPKTFLKKIAIGNARIFFQGENIYAWWHSNNPFPDPESGALTSTSKNMPPARSFILGIQTTF